MSIYIFLMIFPFILGLLCYPMRDHIKRNKIISILFFSFLFILFIVRDVRVGRDLPGYEAVYYESMNYQLFDSSWIYMEPGYVTAMQIANILGISFRGFIALLYLVIVIPLAVFISKYSKDIVLSLIIYICFQFFVFNMSGLRQSVAMGICLIAFMVANKNGVKAFLKFIILIVLASTFHKSAIIFFPMYFVMRQRLTWPMIIMYSIIAVFLIVFRDNILFFFQDNDFTNYTFDEMLTVGPTFFLTLFIVIYCFFAKKDKGGETSFLNIRDNVFGKAETIHLSISNCANILMCGILVLLAFSGSILMRAANYYQLIILILLPNILLERSKEERVILRIGIIFLMYFIFYMTVLLPSQFDIVPYKIASSIEFFK